MKLIYDLEQFWDFMMLFLCAFIMMFLFTCMVLGMDLLARRAYVQRHKDAYCIVQENDDQLCWPDELVKKVMVTYEYNKTLFPKADK